MIVTPSILTDTAESVFAQVDRLSPYFDWFQIDIADGVFVPNRTVSLSELGTALAAEGRAEKWSRLSFDMHLMVQEVDAAIAQLVPISEMIQIRNILIHTKVNPRMDRLRDRFPMFTIGLVLNPEETVEDFVRDYDLRTVPIIQIMSVSPGFQGSPFQPDTLNKIEQLREHNYRKDIFLDGAINAETLPVILSRTYPPTGIGPGSYLSKAEDIPSRVRELRALLGQV
jgi:pentose-5-phosphate-3-epimerase